MLRADKAGSPEYISSTGPFLPLAGSLKRPSGYEGRFLFAGGGPLRKCGLLVDLQAAINRYSADPDRARAAALSPIRWPQPYLWRFILAAATTMELPVWW
jgi:hypothetical protein